jgi:hypothetical protein
MRGRSLMVIGCAFQPTGPAYSTAGVSGLGHGWHG